MAVKSGFFPDNNGDRTYMSDFIAKMIHSLIGNGVKVDSFKVSPGDGMNVSVDSGEGWINGYFISSDTKSIFPVPAASGVLDRIDAIMIRLSHNNREITVEYVAGTPSSVPKAPTPTRTSDVIELKVAEVYVNAGATKITASQIADTRANNDVCGYVTGVVDQITTTELFSQFQALFDDFMDDIQGKLGDDPATSLQNQINGLTNQLEETELRVADQEPEIATLTPLNGFSLTNVNKPATAIRQGRKVHVQIGVEQSSTANRIFTQLPQGMYDNNTHLVPGINGNNGDVYPISIDRYGRVSFNGAAIKDVYINATFTLEG